MLRHLPPLVSFIVSHVRISTPSVQVRRGSGRLTTSLHIDKSPRIRRSPSFSLAAATSACPTSGVTFFPSRSAGLILSIADRCRRVSFYLDSPESLVAL
ncbi:hypothetical protein PC116_g14086 [Phytophthora cactorum]|nr:hypothetical protein PC116_g14086 [Phytophthora cactorum]